MHDFTQQLFHKVVTLTDVHFGRNSNSPVANQDNLDFIEWFIEEAKIYGADTCIMMGDWHDNRNTLSVLTMDYSLRGMEMLNAAFKKIWWVPGNHDLLYRDKRDITSVAFVRHLPNIEIIREPVTIGGVTILPWLVNDEPKKVKKMKSRYTFGHLELPGFLMNAKVEMPVHANGITTDDFKGGAEYVFSGHFHFRQAKENVIYTGNPMPFNFADSWDEDRGMMFLDWGKEPVFKAWPGQPTYRTMKLSDLLNQPEKMLRDKLTARVTLDLDISYEEAQVIRDEYSKRYGVRKIELLHASKTSVNDQDFAAPVAFQSVDQIVMDGLLSVKSETLDNKRLVEIYRSLPAL
jgi:DNA repair exonuclease SbcCD nuclease subunit